MSFILVVFLIGLGVVMVWKTSWFLDFFGRVPWAERYLGSGYGAGLGGSWSWYKLLGILVIVGALLYMTGLLEILLVKIFSGFIPPR